jgi:PAS domain S-box-containing protein
MSSKMTKEQLMKELDTLRRRVAEMEALEAERKQAEEALRAGESKYRALFEAVLDGAIVVDAQTLSIVAANEAAAKMYGLDSAKDSVGMSLFDFVAREERPHVVRAAEDLFEKDLGRVDRYRTLSRDGRGIWVSAVARKTEYEGRLAGLISLRDITDQKRAEEELRSSEERYRLLFNNSGEPITVFGIDGRLLLINAIGVNNFGGRPEDFVGKSCYELFPEQGGTYLERLQGVALSGLATDFEDVVELPSGKRWFWSILQPIREENGNVYAVQVVSHDITERKRVEEALRESEAKYSALVEQAADGVVIVQDGIIKFANSGHARITGYSVAELVGMPFLNTVDPSIRNLADQRYAMRVAGSPFSVAFETRILCKDGTVKEAEARSSTIQYQGRPAVLSIVRMLPSASRQRRH